MNIADCKGPSYTEAAKQLGTQAMLFTHSLVILSSEQTHLQKRTAQFYSCQRIFFAE